MGYKGVCTKCRKSFSEGNNPKLLKERICSECKCTLYIVHHKFKPPKKTDLKKWKVIDYLLKNGFNFQSHWMPYGEGKEKFIFKVLGNYPTNMKDAEEFVKKYSRNKNSY
tara:strand:- start:45 stop:374 length:330 start_codon:yes stop_codon:yes gene_type:complete